MGKKWDEGELSATSRDKQSFGERTSKHLSKLKIISPVVVQRFEIKAGLWVSPKEFLKTDEEIEQFVKEMRVKYCC